MALPASRTTLSMARARAMPAALARIHPRFSTPHVSTVLIGILAATWYVGANSLSENFLLDTLSALALMIAFYYALSGYACVNRAVSSYLLTTRLPENRTC